MSDPAPPEDHAAIAELERRMRRQDRRSKYAAWAIGLLGFAGVTVWPVWHEWLETALPTRVYPVVGLSGGLLFLFGPMYVFSWLVVRRRRSLRRPAMLTADPRPQGFATFNSPNRGSVAAFLLTLAGLWADIFGVSGRQTYHVPDGLTMAVAAVAIAGWMLHRGPRVLLLPDRLVVRRWRTRSVPWAQLAAAPARPGARAHELSLAVDGPGGPGVLRIPMHPLEVDPDFLADVIGHYITCPQDRTAIGSLSELARRRQDYLATTTAASPTAASPALAGQS